MKTTIVRIASLALILAPSLLAQTLTIKNSTQTATYTSTHEESPTVTPAMTTNLAPGASVDTKLPANGNTLNYVLLQQNGVNIANTPYLLTNVLTATIQTNCSPSDTQSPCVYCTPAKTSDPDAVRKANAFLAERSTTKEYCMPGVASTHDDTRYFALANGLVVILTGMLDKVPADGAACLCGVMATPPAPANTITFEVRALCDAKAKRERKTKN
ncbi:MAG TPA: hypothetical protein VN181_08485 [Thermoanaerobaculia bacterium]|nr:hypothetical protein [Thermoanaerobaculia bacterium]